MNILNGITNFLRLINDKWTEILVLIGLVLMLVRKIKNYISKSDDEKISIAKDIVCKTMLERVSNAEKDYADWVKAGAAKRAQVISNIYADYPILCKVIDQDGLIAWMDDTINESLKQMREMLKAEVE